MNLLRLAIHGKGDRVEKYIRNRLSSAEVQEDFVTAENAADYGMKVIVSPQSEGGADGNVAG